LAKREEQKEGRRVFAVEEEENQPKENGFSNRHVSTTFIPPLTKVAFDCLFVRSN